MLVVECVYVEIKVWVLICFMLVMVVNIVGFDNVVLVVGSYVVFGVFIVEVWCEYVQLVIKDVVISEQKNVDWVLQILIKDDLMLEGSLEQIQKLLIVMYKCDYVDEWKNFVQGIMVVFFEIFLVVVVVMNCLGDVQILLVGMLIKVIFD